MDWQQILIVDDSNVILLFVQNLLDEAGFKVWTATSGEEALQLITRQGLPHLAIVDINMPPGMDGFQFCRRVHQFSDLPILLLSSLEDEATVVKGLDEFAEDYMIKPQQAPLRGTELVSRVKRILNRFGDYSYRMNAVTQIDASLAINFPQRQAIIDAKIISLTPTETKILYILVRHAGRTLTNDYLLRRIWPLEEAYEDRLHTHLYRLRRKIEKNPKEPHYILSEWGKGYLFLAPNNLS